MRSRAVTVLAALAVTISLMPASATENPRSVGRWLDPFWEGGALPFDPPSADRSRAFPTAVAASMLPDGRLVYWNGLEGSENGTVFYLAPDGTLVVENSRARLLDLRSGQPRWTIPTLERGTTDQPRDKPPLATQDIFCSDQKLLYDGTLLIAGGSRWGPYDVYGIRDARVFNPDTDTFSSVGSMREPRWYPSLVTLSDGRVMVVSGVRRLVGTVTYPDHAFSQVRLTETYDPAARTWNDAGVSDWSFPFYPRLHLLPDGKVFYGGAGQSWGHLGETPDEAMWGFQRLYDPTNETWTTLGLSRYGVRSGATSTLLRLEPPYDQARVLLAGGTLGPTPGAWVATTLSEIVQVTPNGIVNEPRIKSPIAGLGGDRSQLRNRRWLGSSVMLPTGEVLLVNGGDGDDVLDPGSAAAIRTPELNDPKTGTWREMAAASRDRVYHNSAVLLPDGRVLVGGHAPHVAHNYHHGNVLARSNNFRDSTFEIYEPPYLFRGERPTIHSLSISSTGRTMTIDATEADEVVLVRLAAITHAQDADMRAVVLERSVNTDGTISASLPGAGDGRIVPPGPYYLFVNRLGPDGGVPSHARTVLVQPDAATGDVMFALPG